MAHSRDEASASFNTDANHRQGTISGFDAITQILESGKTIAVLGLSNQRVRASKRVAK